ncbi:hypothetical protein CEXT_685911 [Caerostris extrusa]|uniref:Uncharacterized protein n=1 Tax=Caerostris extrusa TaxID=172846 RepID=A0AAV4Q6V7_CAEEX|nr:hypothetical protein CEXT_685911 [Caerostris extrusa]
MFQRSKHTNKQMQAWKKRKQEWRRNRLPKIALQERIDGYSETEYLFRDLGDMEGTFLLKLSSSNPTCLHGEKKTPKTLFSNICGKK